MRVGFVQYRGSENTRGTFVPVVVSWCWLVSACLCSFRLLGVLGLVDFVLFENCIVDEHQRPEMVAHSCVVVFVVVLQFLNGFVSIYEFLSFKETFMCRLFGRGVLLLL